MLMLGEKEQVFFSKKLSSCIDRVSDTSIIPRVGFRFLLLKRGFALWNDTAICRISGL